MTPLEAVLKLSTFVRRSNLEISNETSISELYSYNVLAA
jgi:hypothetical protein